MATGILCSAFQVKLAGHPRVFGYGTFNANESSIPTIEVLGCNGVFFDAGGVFPTSSCVESFHLPSSVLKKFDLAFDAMKLISLAGPQIRYNPLQVFTIFPYIRWIRVNFLSTPTSFSLFPLSMFVNIYFSENLLNMENPNSFKDARLSNPNNHEENLASLSSSSSIFVPVIPSNIFENANVDNISPVINTVVSEFPHPSVYAEAIVLNDIPQVKLDIVELTNFVCLGKCCHPP